MIYYVWKKLTREWEGVKEKTLPFMSSTPGFQYLHPATLGPTLKKSREGLLLGVCRCCFSDLLIIMIIYYHINPNNLADCKNVKSSPSIIKINIKNMCFLLLCGGIHFWESFYKNIFEAAVLRKIYFLSCYLNKYI